MYKWLDQTVFYTHRHHYIWSAKTEIQKIKGLNLLCKSKADLLPRQVESLILFLVQLLDGLQDFCFVVFNNPLLLHQVVILHNDKTRRHSHGCDLETSPTFRSLTSPFLLLHSACSLPSCWHSSPAWWWSPPASSDAGRPRVDYLSWSRTKYWAGQRTGAPSVSSHVLPASVTPDGEREEREKKLTSLIIIKLQIMNMYPCSREQYVTH